MSQALLYGGIFAAAAALFMVAYTLKKGAGSPAASEAESRLAAIGQLMERFHRSEDVEERWELARQALTRARAVLEIAPGYAPAISQVESCEAALHQMVGDRIKNKVAFIMMDAQTKGTHEEKIARGRDALNVIDELGAQLPENDPRATLLRQDVVMFQESVELGRRKREGADAEGRGDREAALTAYGEALAYLRSLDDRLILREKPELEEKIAFLRRRETAVNNS